MTLNREKAEKIATGILIESCEKQLGRGCAWAFQNEVLYTQPKWQLPGQKIENSLHVFLLTLLFDYAEPEQCATRQSAQVVLYLCQEVELASLGQVYFPATLSAEHQCINSFQSWPGFLFRMEINNVREWFLESSVPLQDYWGKSYSYFLSKKIRNEPGTLRELHGDDEWTDVFFNKAEKNCLPFFSETEFST